jgi:hypothetical protein
MVKSLTDEARRRNNTEDNQQSAEVQALAIKKNLRKYPGYESFSRT